MVAPLSHGNQGKKRASGKKGTRQGLTLGQGDVRIGFCSEGQLMQPRDVAVKAEINNPFCHCFILNIH